MKKYIIFLIFFAIEFTAKSQVDRNLIPLRNKDYWGLADFNRKIVVQPLFEYVMIYDNYMKSYQVLQNGKYGLIDDKGQWLIPAISESVIYKRNDNLVIRIANNLEYYTQDYQLNNNYQEPKQKYSEMTISEPKTYKLTDEDKDILKEYSKENGFNIYQLDEEFSTISKDTTYVEAETNYQIFTGTDYGIYVPKLKKIFTTTKNGSRYEKATCNDSVGCLFIVSKNKNFGVIDELENEIIPFKYKEIKGRKDYLLLKDENHYYTYLIKSKKTIEGYFSLYENPIIVDGKNKKIFYQYSKRTPIEKHTETVNHQEIPMTYSLPSQMIEYINEEGEPFYFD